MTERKKLSGKEIARITQALGNSPLRVFDVPEDGLAQLRQLRSLVNEVGQSVDKFPVAAQSLLQALLCGDKNLSKVFSGIDSRGVRELARLTQEMLDNPNVLNDVTLRVVFGGSEKMSVRALAYITPVLQLVEHLRKVYGQNQPQQAEMPLPQIEFVFMSEMGVLTNKLNRTKVFSELQFFVEAAEKYCQQFHPGLLSAIRFVDDTTFTLALLEHESFQEFANNLFQALDPNSELAQHLLEMGSAYGDPHLGNSVRYAAEHTFVHDGVVTPKIAEFHHIAGTHASRATRYLFSIGAKPEATFYELRTLGKEMIPMEVLTRVPTAQYLINIDKAPYLPLKGGGDLFLEDAIRDPSVLIAAGKRDFQGKSDYQTPVAVAVQMLSKDVEEGVFMGITNLREFFESLNV